ncbi:MAG: lysophospholipid acyltransferase family protein [Spirochaetota bacterium]
MEHDLGVGTPPTEYWEFESPPNDFDLVRNTFISNAVRFFLNIVIRVYLSVYHRIEYHGRARAHGVRGAIIIANHASHLDAPVLVSAFPLSRRNSVRSLAAKDYFFTSAFRRMASFLLANSIPIDRGRVDSASFRFCADEMQQGMNIIMFPEGTRTADGAVKPFKPGIGMLVCTLRAPVLPIYIQGAYEGFPRDRMLPSPKKVRVFIGEMMRFDTGPNTADHWREIAGCLHATLLEMEKRAKEASVATV